MTFTLFLLALFAVALMAFLHANDYLPVWRQAAVLLFAVELAVLLLIVVQLSADGMRSTFPMAGMKLWKIPVVGPRLFGSQAFYRLDLAFAFANVLVVVAAVTWKGMMEYLLRDAPLELSLQTWFAPPTDGGERWWWVMRVFGAMLTGADLAFFWLGMAYGGGFSPTAAAPVIAATIMTCAYLAMLGLFALGSVTLWKMGGSR